MKKIKRNKIITITLILSLVIIFGIILFFLAENNVFGNETVLSEHKCVYNNQDYLICGKPYILVSGGVEYSLEANEPFHIPEGRNDLVGLIDETKPEGERVFFIFLQEGEHTVNEENSKKALASFIAKDFVE